jgi:uncharacterized membrane protein YbhN (UPF0104 family)
MLEKRDVKHRLVWLAVGVAVFLGLVWYSGTSDLSRVLEADPIWLVSAFACTVFITVFWARRWGLLANKLTGSSTVPNWWYYHSLILSRAVSLFVPESVGAFGTGTLSLRFSQGVPMTIGLYSLILDRLFDLLTALLLVLPAILFILGIWPVIPSYALYISILGLLWVILEVKRRTITIFLLRSYSWLITVGADIPVVGSRFQPLEICEEESNLLLTAQDARKLYIDNLGKLLSVVLRWYSLALAFHLPVSFAWILFGSSIVQVSRVFSVTPGSLGVLEAGWYAVLSLGGVDGPLIIAFLIGQRVLISTFLLILAAITQLVTVFRHGHLAPE